MAEENTITQPPAENNELENLKKECEEYKSRSLRAQADYQNLQKEVERKRSEWVKMSEAQILEDFIPVYDHLKLALQESRIKNQELSSDQWFLGVTYVLKQFADIFKNYGVEEIKTVGEMFDPRFHEAVGEQNDGDKSDMIVREVSGGYKMGERVIKCAKVIISK